MATLIGDGNNNTLIGTSGDDSLSGLGGNDSLSGGGGADFLDGGVGNDTISDVSGSAWATFASDVLGVNANLVLGTAIGSGTGNDLLVMIVNLQGSMGNDTLTGDAGPNALWGLAGDDHLDGGDSRDSLWGGVGSDTLTGGLDGDVFTFTNILEISSTADHITDFEIGDRLYLFSILQLTFIGDAPFTGIANQYRYAFVDADTEVQVDTDGDGLSDRKIVLDGLNVHLVEPTPGLRDLKIFVATGSNGFDQLSGTNGDDTLSGMGGSDILNGVAGNDCLDGGDGADCIFGNADDDTVLGGEGNDLIEGGIGDNSLDGGSGIDTATFQNITTGITASLITSTATGWGGSDTILNFENLTGSKGNDRLTGDSGANILMGLGGNDTLDGGAGIDTVSYDAEVSGVTASLASGSASGASIDIDTLVGIENLIGTLRNDTLTGNSGANILRGGKGDDLLNGGSGSDTLSFEYSFLSTERVTASLATGRASGIFSGNDTFSNFEALLGSEGNDQLSGSAGNDSLYGWIGNDILIGAAGNDALDGGLDSDTASYIAETTGVTASLIDGIATGSAIGADTLVGIENLTGGIGDDCLIGDSAANILDGRQGNDSLLGGDGIDTVIFTWSGPVNVNLTTGVAVDVTTGTDFLSGIENLIGTDAPDTLIGNNIDNVLDGESGNDQLGDIGGNGTLIGASGNDTLDGGSGDDVVQYSGAQSDYAITDNPDGSHTIEDLRAVSPDGTDLLIDIEHAVFLAGGSIDFTGGGNDTIIGDIGNNSLNGLAGDDSIGGLEGNDSLSGGDGNDTLSGDAGDDSLDGGSSTANNSLIGGDGNDTLYGSDGQDRFNGGIGDDSLSGGLGFDQFTGFLGTDTIDGGDPDLIPFIGGDLILLFGTSTDLNNATDAQIVNIESVALLGSGGVIDLRNQTESFSISTGAGAGLGSDTLFGGAGNDTLAPSDGTDSMSGGLGDDVYWVEEAGDIVTEEAFEGADTVYVTLSAYTLTANFENLAYAGPFGLMGAGNDDANRLEGSLTDDTLTGAGGNDTFIWSGGADVIDGESGIDGVLVDYGIWGAFDLDTATDTQIVNVELVSVANAFAPVFLDLTNQSEDLTITGSQFDDTLIGGAGDNIAQYSGAHSDYAIIDNPDGTHTIEDLRSGSPDGIDLLIDIEHAVFLAGGFIDFTGSGNDTILGNSGDNSLEGLTGNDSLDGADGHDTLIGGDGNDTLLGGTGDDFLEGDSGTGNDSLIGGLGNDTLDGGPGADTAAGGDGHDTYVVDDAADVVTEVNGSSHGTDTVITSLALYTLATPLEKLIHTGNVAFTGNGNAASNAITGNSGDDTLTGLGGSDTLDGSAGLDSLIGGLGNDAYWLDSPGDVVSEIPDGGTDTVMIAGPGAYILAANAERMTASGSASVSLTGNAGNNTLTGGIGNDTLYGGGGLDRLVGGNGDDLYRIDTVGTAISDNKGIDAVVTLLTNYTLASNVENLTFTLADWVTPGSAAFTGLGSGIANRITGGTGNDSLSGLNGNDTLIGNDGNDSLGGDAGNDSIQAGVGDDTANGGAGNDAIEGGDGSDTIDGGAGRDTVAGGLGADLFVFKPGDLVSGDKIIGFSNAEGDLIDLSLIDAILGGGDDPFAFIGTAAFTKLAGQLRYVVTATGVTVQGDTDGDGKADSGFALVVDGVASLLPGDFIL